MSREESLVDWSTPGAEDELIFGTTHLPAAGRPPVGVVLICHGFKGYKDYGFFPYLASSLARDGFIAHRFNFSHSGVTPVYQKFERLDLFEKDTWAKQMHDLSAVHQAVRDAKLPGGIGAETLPVIWFGHSRGGVTVLLTAADGHIDDNAEATLADAVGPAGLITAAAPDYSLSLSDEETQQLREQGYLETVSGRTGQTMRIGRQWLETVERDPERYDPLLAARRCRIPLLILHAQGDETVPVAAAHHLAKAAGSRARVHIVADSNHVFSAANPMELPAPVPTQSLTEEVIEFCHECASD